MLKGQQNAQNGQQSQVYTIKVINFFIGLGDICCNWCLLDTGVWWRKEGNVLFNDTLNTFYLRLYGVRHMVKNHSDMREETRCRHIGYSFWLAARVLLYASSHRQDNTYCSLCYTSRGALAGTRNSSMGPPHEGSIRRPIAPWANALTTELHLAPGVWWIKVGWSEISFGFECRENVDSALLFGQFSCKLDVMACPIWTGVGVGNELCSSSSVCSSVNWSGNKLLKITDRGIREFHSHLGIRVVPNSKLSMRLKNFTWRQDNLCCRSVTTGTCIFKSGNKKARRVIFV